MGREARGRQDEGAEQFPGGDEAAERRRRQASARTIADQLAMLRDIEVAWVELADHTRPVRTQRDMEAMTAHAAQLVEMTAVAGSVHPTKRPLRPLLERCPRIVGDWSLDTRAHALTLIEAKLWLPPLPLFVDSDTDPEWLLVRVDLRQPAADEDMSDVLLASTLRGGEAGAHQHITRVNTPVLSSAVRDHLVAALPTATVLSRTAGDDGIAGVRAPRPDRDVDGARAADRLVDLLAGLEHALTRRAIANRGPDGDAPGDAEVANRQAIVFDIADRIELHVRQTLPAGTLEPVLLSVDGRTGDDPDGLDVLPVGFVLELDLRDGHRGEGLIHVSTWAGGAERALLLPHLPDLWDDHIDSALRRAHVIIPAVRRTPDEENALPVRDVDPPLAESTGRGFSRGEIPF